ncbi:MAG: hypothetical protein ACPL0A_03945 [Candidatus Micrarchaeia archaeon]
MKSEYKNHVKRTIAAGLIGASLFLNQHVLADKWEDRFVCKKTDKIDYYCEKDDYEPDTILFTKKCWDSNSHTEVKKMYPISFENTIMAFGKIIEFNCNDEWGIFIFEKAILRGKGVKDTLEKGLSGFMYKRNPKTGQIGLDQYSFADKDTWSLWFSGEDGVKAVKAKIMWNKVAVVLLANGDVIIFKGLSDPSDFVTIQTTYRYVDMKSASIEISGNEIETRINIKFSDTTKKLLIEGKTREDIRITELD